ncbi:hypothetical protein EHS25_005306 [Saitozyma podzolica]|uniref:Uncharacterized protein n=1 Tax=Saitozyma podzolica TaxID=1890683 RepID=A0A427XZ07_9TREE|nr:hypothetical protein EHS25_005306 [Saitozyma podzolica]
MPETVTILMEMRRRRSAESLKTGEETNNTSKSTASASGGKTSGDETSNDKSSSSSDAPKDQTSTPSEGKKD